MTKMRSKRAALLAAAILGAVMATAGARAAPLPAKPILAPPDLAPRRVPAKIIPVPDDVSPGLQALIAQPLRKDWDRLYRTGTAWRAAADKLAATAEHDVIPPMLQRLHVQVRPVTVDGVRAFLVTPAEVPVANRDKLLIHVHGGCYVLSPGESGTIEAILMAGLGGYRVLSVDYRMPPEAYFPAALDDAITVYKAALRDHPARDIGFFGSSAGGALTLEMVLRARQLGLPMPGAIAPGTPMSDITGRGDTFKTNALVDNVLVSPKGFCDAAARVYAHGHDLRDPLLSPVYGDMHGFPPTILTTGTRDLLLSNTVRVHRKLREAGVDAELEVFEAMSHAQFIRDDRIPEDREAFAEIAEFFTSHLGAH